MSEEQERNISRALIDEGPYKIPAECRRLIVLVDKWLSMSKEQKERKLKQFLKMALSEEFGGKSLATSCSSPTIFGACLCHLGKNRDRVQNMVDKEVYLFPETLLGTSQE